MEASGHGKPKVLLIQRPGLKVYIESHLAFSGALSGAQSYQVEMDVSYEQGSKVMLLTPLPPVPEQALADTKGPQAP